MIMLDYYVKIKLLASKRTRLKINVEKGFLEEKKEVVGVRKIN